MGFIQLGRCAGRRFHNGEIFGKFERDVETGRLCGMWHVAGAMAILGCGVGLNHAGRDALAMVGIAWRCGTGKGVLRR